MSRPNHDGRSRKLRVERLEERAMLAGDWELLGDLNEIAAGSFTITGPAVAVGSQLFFPANNVTNGLELWKTDQTGRSQLVKDIAPGQSFSSPRYLTNVAGTLYFQAFNPVNGAELWKSDGTAAGTVLVKDVVTGSASSEPASLTNVSGTLYFRSGRGLWKSDGTSAGTVLVWSAASSSSYFRPSQLTNVAGTLYFTSDGAVYKSDGTATGTVQLSTTGVGLRPNASNLTDVAGVLYFAAWAPNSGRELWKSDGTIAGTVLVKDIAPSAAYSSPSFLTNVGGTLFFGASDGVHGFELWKSYGTAEGTLLVKDVNVGANSSMYPVSNARSSALINVAGTLHFLANDGVSGRELWKSDGTTEGTVLVKDIYAGAQGSMTNSQTESDWSPVAIGGSLFFRANSDLQGAEVWRSDGTAGGTVVVKDLPADSTNSFTSISWLTNADGTLYFQAVTRNQRLAGNQLWKSDGTTVGTVRVLSASEGIFTNGVTHVGAWTYFLVPKVVGDSTSSLGEIWRTNGTIVEPLKFNFGGLRPYDEIADATQLVNVGGVLYFADSYGELWKSDGSTAGTMLIKFVAAIDKLFNFQGVLYFIGSDNQSFNKELWKSDGTEAGTVVLKEINPGFFSANISSLTEVSGTLYFSANDGANGQELWKTDGTAAGTVMVKNIRSGNANSDPSNLTNVNGTLYFSANDGTSGVELWKSDGTSAGTVRVKDIRTDGRVNSNPSLLTNVNGILYFVPSAVGGGIEPWRSDGTEAGTFQLKDVRQGVSSSYPTVLANINGILYFVANDGINGYELWKSDSTAAGTGLVKDVFRGSGSSNVTSLTNINGKLYFSANDGVNGQELWSTDGTTAGTQLVYDFTQDSTSSSPGPIFVVNNKLHVAAAVYPIGRELWVADISPPLPGDYNGDRIVDLNDYNVWRDTFGSTTNLAADGNGDRVIDAADYVIWRSNYQSPTPNVPIGRSPPRRAPFVPPSSPVAIVAAASASTSATSSADSSPAQTDLLLTARDAAFAALGEDEPAAQKPLAKSPPRRAARTIPAALSDSAATFKP